MTILSLRVDDAEADAARAWADRLGIDRSELLREALHQYLVRLSAEHDVAASEASPPTGAEQALAEAANWGPAEDWSDWADAARWDLARHQSGRGSTCPGPDARSGGGFGFERSW